MTFREALTDTWNQIWRREAWYVGAFRLFCLATASLCLAVLIGMTAYYFATSAILSGIALALATVGAFLIGIGASAFRFLDLGWVLVPPPVLLLLPAMSLFVFQLLEQGPS